MNWNSRRGGASNADHSVPPPRPPRIEDHAGDDQASGDPPYRSASFSGVGGSGSGGVDPGAEIFGVLEVVERDSVAHLRNYASLRLTLSQATSTSAKNMQCLNDVIRHLQESAVDPGTKGNR